MDELRRAIEKMYTAQAVIRAEMKKLEELAQNRGSQDMLRIKRSSDGTFRLAVYNEDDPLDLIEMPNEDKVIVECVIRGFIGV